MSGEIQLIINPEARREVVSSVEKSFVDRFGVEVRRTAFPFNERPNFSEKVVILGGDGTISGVLQEIYSRDENLDDTPVVAVTRAGSRGTVHRMRVMEGALVDSNQFLALEKDFLKEEMWYYPATVNGRVFVSTFGIGQFEAASAYHNSVLRKGRAPRRLEQAALRALWEVTYRRDSRVPLFYSIMPAPYSEVVTRTFSGDMSRELLRVVVDDKDGEGQKNLRRLLAGLQFNNRKILPHELFTAVPSLEVKSEVERMNYDGEFLEGVAVPRGKLRFRRDGKRIPLVALV